MVHKPSCWFHYIPIQDVLPDCEVVDPKEVDMSRRDYKKKVDTLSLHQKKQVYGELCSSHYWVNRYRDH